MKKYLFLSLFPVFKVLVLLALLTAPIPSEKVIAQTGMALDTLEDQKTLSISDGIVAVPCDQITVPVNIDNAADIAGMDLEIIFDPNILILVDVNRTYLTEGFLMDHWEPRDGILFVSMASSAGITSGTGALVHLIFKVLSNAISYDSTGVSIEEVFLYNEEADPIEGIIQQGGQIALQGHKMDFQAGWSMISLPAVPDNASVSALFPNAKVVYKYEKGLGYTRVLGSQQLEPGRGYWILFNEEQSYILKGKPIRNYSFPIYEDGWEMIGGCTCPAQPTVNQGKISIIYQYVQGIGYKRLTAPGTLEPGKGYWILFHDVEIGAEFSVEILSNNDSG